MEGWNPLIGGPAPQPDVDDAGPAAPMADTDAVIDGDRTEYVVATFVIVAVALLILIRLAGFQAVLATRVGVGG